MVDVSISPIMAISILQRFLKIIKNPKKSYYITRNLIRGFWNFHFYEGKPFVINERIVQYTIYPNGEFILFSNYDITMLTNIDFELDKFYETENTYNKVDLRKMESAKYKFDSEITKNRFKDYLNVVELNSTSNQTNDMSVIQEKTTIDKYEYTIIYPGRKRFNNFTFSLSTTIPDEFNRKDMNFSSIIQPMYGIYTLLIQLDKQSLNSKIFVPEIHSSHSEEKDIKNSKKSDIDTMHYSDINTMYYIGKKWELFLPKNNIISFKKKYNK